MSDPRQSIITPAAAPTGRITVRIVLAMAVCLLLLGVVPFVYLPKVFLPRIHMLMPFWKELMVLVCPVILYALLPSSAPRPMRFLTLILVALVVLAFQKIRGVGNVYGLLPYFAFAWCLFWFHTISTRGLRLLAYAAAIFVVVGSFGVVWDSYAQYFRYLTVDGISTERTYIEFEGAIRPAFLFGGPTHASFVITLGCGILLLGADLVEARWTRFIIKLAFFAGVVGVLKTLGRVGYVGLFIQVLGLAVAAICVKGLFKKASFTIAVLGFVAVVLGVGMVFSDPIVARRLELSVTGEIFTDKSNADRLQMWAQGLESLKDNWLLGAGIGSGQDRLGRIIDVKHYENGWLAVFNEGGILVISIFFLILLEPIGRAVAVLRQRGSYYGPWMVMFTQTAVFAMLFANPLQSDLAVCIYMAATHAIGIRLLEATHSHGIRQGLKFRSNLVPVASKHVPRAIVGQNAR